MNLTVNIESVDRTSYVLWRTFVKIDNLNARIDTCYFQTRRYGAKTWKPAVGDEIEILDNATKVFAGVVVSVRESPESANIQKYDVRCKDWTHYLDKRLVVERYTNQTVNQIISSILTDYTSGFTDTKVDCGITIGSIAFNYVTVSQAIQMLAEQVNYCWYVDYDKDIHFFAKNSEVAPFSLSDTSGNYIFKSLRIKDDLSQLRNLVLIRGGDKKGNPRTENFTGNDKKKTFVIGHKFSERPIVFMGTPQTVGIEFLDIDENFDCLWNFNEKYIRFVGTPVSGTAIVVTGTPYIPILVQVQDDESIQEYGRYEFKKIDKSIKTSVEAKQYAISQLEAYKATIKAGSFKTYTSGLRSGQVITVQSTIRGISEDFLIQSVSLRMRGYNEGMWLVNLATLRTVGIIDFLQRLLTDETKKITIGEDEVLEKYYTDHQIIEIAELISLHTEMEEHQTVQITELIRKDPWTPEWVLAPYFPSSDADPKRPFRLGISSYLY